RVPDPDRDRDARPTHDGVRPSVDQSRDRRGPVSPPKKEKRMNGSTTITPARTALMLMDFQPAILAEISDTDTLLKRAHAAEAGRGRYGSTLSMWVLHSRSKTLRSSRVTTRHLPRSPRKGFLPTAPRGRD